MWTAIAKPVAKDLNELSTVAAGSCSRIKEKDFFEKRTAFLVDSKVPGLYPENYFEKSFKVTSFFYCQTAAFETTVYQNTFGIKESPQSFNSP